MGLGSAHCLPGPWPHLSVSGLRGSGGPGAGGLGGLLQTEAWEGGGRVAISFGCQEEVSVNPGLATCYPCDIGQVTQSLRACVFSAFSGDTGGQFEFFPQLAHVSLSKPV